MLNPGHRRRLGLARLADGVSGSAARTLWGIASAIVLGLGHETSAAEAETTRRYLVDTWPSERGLPQNTVTGIAQTPDGYLWVSTLDGLARFDGVRFKMYKAGDTPELGSGRIRFLFAGRHGKLWLALQEGSVVEMRDGRFQSLPLPPKAGVRPAAVQIVEEASGVLWLSEEEGAVRRFAAGEWSVVSTNRTPRSPLEVRTDAGGRLWAIDNQGLYRVEGDRMLPALPGEACRVLAASQNGGWWLLHRNTIRLWRDGAWLATAGNPGVAAERVACGLEDHAGRLWLGTLDQGVFRCNTNGTVVQVSKRDGLGSDAVRVLYEDSEGNVWIGMDGGGLTRLRAPLFAVYGPPQGLSSERISSVSEGARGELWVGTDGYGLNCLEDERARPVDQDKTPLRVGAVLGSRTDGDVWLGIRSGGLLRWNGERFLKIDGMGLPTRCLFQDARGGVWVGQRNTRRVVRFQGPDRTDLPLPLPSADVRVMAEDAAGGVWLGTDGSGLLRWKDERIARFTREQGLGSDFIWALRPEPDGSLWIGTYGGGLTRLKDGRFVTCTTRHGLVDDVICHIADDGRGHYWFSSNQGIFRVAKAELNQFADGARSRIHCVAYGRSDGLPTLECEGGCQPAGCRSRDGRLWFPTIRGLVAVDPAEISTNALPPPVYVEELLVDGQPQALPPAQLRPGPIAITPGSGHFQFRYTGLNFSAPERLRFRHRLEGVDAEWVDTGGQREASYDRLAHGSYIFRVQACNREGVWSQTGAELAFTVLPHFWQTFWFMALFLVLFGGGVGWSVGQVLRRRHQRHLQLVQRLHLLERERVRVARDIHDDLGASLTEISYAGALAVRDSTSLADVRTRVERILQRIRELSAKLDETVWAVNPKNDSLPQLATYLCHFAREYLETANLRCRLDVAPELPDLELTTEARHNVFLAVKEAMHNAVKHARCTEVSLRMAAHAGELAVDVSDDGAGFAVESRRETGNGLRNLAARMAEIGGSFTVRGAPGAGTTVSLRLPLPAPPPSPIRMGDAGRPPQA